MAVGELAREFPISRPAISQHLSVLKRAHLVTDAAEGARRLYTVNPEAVASLRKFFEQFWMDALASFKRRAELEARKKQEGR